METHHKTDSKNTMIIAGAIIIAGVLIAGSVYLGNRTSPQGAGNPAPSNGGNVAVDASKVNTTNEPFIGNKNAPLTIAYWYDYQCPYCKQNEQTSMTQLVKDYVNTGKVKLIYKDYAFLGADSNTLGMFSRAVWETAPAKFLDWHKAIFANQGQENSGWATDAAIQSITVSVLGTADTAKVESLVKSNGAAYQKEMDADKAEGSALGVTGTPALVIGNQLVVGAVPYSKIKATIDGQLK